MKSAEFVYTGIPGPELTDSETALLSKHQPGGVVLFKRNVESAAQLAKLIAELRRICPEAVLAIDAEGGPVDRLKDLVGPAPAPSLLARRPPGVALAAGRWVAQALRIFDLDVDLAPVVDLDRGERGNALDGRYLGPRGALVTPRARAFLRGLHSGGIGGCLKHFPGLGASTVDTHEGVATVALSVDELKADLKPYLSLMTLAGAVMIGHAIYPAYDAKGRPATLAPAVATELLRGRLAFSGLALSDDLEMGALDEWGDLPTRAEAAFTAGCDVLLVCQTLDALPEVAARLARRKHDERRREAGRRLENYRQRLRTLRWASDAVSTDRDLDRRERLRAVRAGLAEVQAV
jgi:beta-N-acetylhexosaminidase